jgi:hypothetical protein
MSAGGASLKPEEATAALGAVGYPGFAYLRNRRPLNPADLLLKVLRARDVEARVVEALPWVLLTYPDLDWAWLVREAKVDDLQNRLGFLVSVARQLAELRGETGTATRLAEPEQTLEGSRLQREGAFRETLTDAERRWLRENRPPHAMRWNMLSTVNASDLAHAFDPLPEAWRSFLRDLDTQLAAGRHQQARDQRGCAAAPSAREAASDDVRAVGDGRSPSELV